MTTALTWTFLAGSATALGGLIAVHRRVRSDTGLAVALAFAAGAMVLVSVGEILPKGAAGLAPALGVGWSWAATLALAFAGAAAVALAGRRGRRTTQGGTPRVACSGVLVAVAITAHNVPEGLATLLSSLDDPAAGAAVAVAIAVHNVPEGVAVAAPLYGAGSSRRRAFGAAGLSGLAEPLGAVVGYLLLAAVLPPAAFGAVFGVLAGVMLRLATAELLPAARALAPPRLVARGLAAGALVMVTSLVLLRLV